MKNAAGYRSLDSMLGLVVNQFRRFALDDFGVRIYACLRRSSGGIESDTWVMVTEGLGDEGGNEEGLTPKVQLPATQFVFSAGASNRFGQINGARHPANHFAICFFFRNGPTPKMLESAESGHNGC